MKFAGNRRLQYFRGIEIIMSAHSTIQITRSAALDYVYNKTRRLDNDELLSRFMDILLDDRLYNVHIVPDHCENQDELLEE